MHVKRGLRVLKSDINIQNNIQNNILSRSKKGSEILIIGHLWELIAVAATVLIMLVAIVGIANNSGYWKKYYAVDLALMSDLQNANQGDFSINYALKEQQNNILTRNSILKSKMFELVITENSIESHDAPKERKTRYTVFPYSKSKNIYVGENSIISEFLVLSKSGDQFSLTSHDLLEKGCLSFDNSADAQITAFSSISLNDETKGFPSPTEYAIKPIISTLGTNSPANINNNNNNNNNIHITIIYAKGDSLTIMDDKTMRGKKLACIIERNFKESSSQYHPTFKEYDGSLDSVKAFSDFKISINGKSNEYWIIVLLPKELYSVNAHTINNLVQPVSNGVREYFR